MRLQREVTASRHGVVLWLFVAVLLVMPVIGIIKTFVL